ncbi:LAFE_0G03444g1_1 [Lachancea fermentati]|uniref:LAFE_0G03444g1_1 n=1 Tax=Lachancea fermentati TaxID=4955 RepID=A0A1G4MH11_LACFM|nr:LAFE_0G03444g1_1 [Lachancea fermentati]
MSSQIDVSLSDIFFKSYGIDLSLGNPIYVFDSTHLPSENEVESKEVYDMLIDELMDHLITKLPSCPYSLVVFSSGFSKNNISWIYGVKMFSKLPKESRDVLQRIYIVHESFFVRTVHQVLTNALNFKFISRERSDILVHISNLTELSRHVDITLLRISLNVYLHDYQLRDHIVVPEEYLEGRSPLAKRQYRQLIFDKIFKRLRIEAPKHELVFQKPGSYQRVNILLDVIKRNNHVDLSQWDVYSLASVFLHFLKNKTKPIFPIDLIPLPINDSPEYTYEAFVRMMTFNNYYDLVCFIFKLFFSLLENADVTRHDYKSISKCLTPTLCQEKVSIKTGDKLAIGYRYVRNVFVHFKFITDSIEKNKDLSVLRNFRDEKVDQNLPSVPRPRKSNPSSSDTNKVDSLGSKMRSCSPPALPKRKINVRSSERANNSSLQSLAVGDERILSKGSNVSTLVDEHPPCTSTNGSTLTLTSDSQDETSSIEIRGSSPLDDAVTFKTSQATEGRLILEEDVSKLILDNNEKIQSFDKELKKKKNAETEVGTKFSQKGYSDIKAGNKVSRLAALYEERLMGLRVIEDLRLRES